MDLGIDQKPVDLILATGSTAMVRDAHSLGKPVYSVGSENVPAFIERTARFSTVGRFVSQSPLAEEFDERIRLKARNPPMMNREERFSEKRTSSGADVKKPNTYSTGIN